MEQPLVSVIALCYNQEDYLEETLDSIAKQTYPNFELIITDDVSKDGSVEKIQRFLKGYPGRSKFIQNQENLGLCRTLNLAVENANGEFIKVIACDDLLDPDFLEIMVTEFQKREDDVSVLHSDARVIDEKGRILSPSYLERNKFDTGTMKELGQFDWFLFNIYPVQGSLIRKRFIQEAGYYDPKVITEDQDMWLRLLRFSRFDFVPRVTASYRKHYQTTHNSLTKEIKKNKENLFRNRFTILLKHLDIQSRMNLEKALLLEWNRVRKEGLSKDLSSIRKDLSSGFPLRFRFLMKWIDWSPRYHLNKIIIKEIY
ncbi:MAG: glycosyltransferase [Bacteroidota bacterium]|nr:glycosyltransferase [Bacteroidota bacterium]